MTKLEKLIKELYPNDIEFKSIGSLIKRSREKGEKEPSIKQVYVVSNSKGMVKAEEYRENTVHSNDTSNYIIVRPGMCAYNPSRLNIGSIAILKGENPGLVSPMYVVFSIDHDMILEEYFEYILDSSYVKNKIDAYKEEGARFRFDFERWGWIKIPLPPLDIQKEIVHILNNFTYLINELNKELNARKKQYEYYRNSLLDFSMIHESHSSLKNTHTHGYFYKQRLEGFIVYDLLKKLCPNGVEYKTLGEIGKFYGGITGKSKNDFIDGNAKFITYKNIYNNIAVDLDSDDKVKIGENETQRTLEYGDIIFTGSSEKPDECGISSVLTKNINEKLYLNSFCFFLRLYNKNILNPEFSKYLFRAKDLRNQIIKTASGVTRFNISKKAMEKVCIPVPPLEVQEEIVKILDVFDKITNDITEGLPAEIELRKKQYEYYRDKLLTFKELEK